MLLKGINCSKSDSLKGLSIFFWSYVIQCYSKIIIINVHKLHLYISSLTIDNFSQKSNKSRFMCLYIFVCCLIVLFLILHYSFILFIIKINKNDNMGYRITYRNQSMTVTRWRQHVEEVKWTRGLRLSTTLLHRVAIGKYKITVVIVVNFIVKLLHLGCNMYY